MVSGSDTLQLAAGTVAVVGGCYGSLQIVQRLWRRSVGSRRDLTGRLNRVACGVTYEYAKALLGVPVFRRPLLEFDECTWRTRHAWVSGLVGDGSLWAFAITVIDPRYRFDCSSLTFGHLRVKLGHSRLAVTTDPTRVTVNVGARRLWIIQQHYFGNPGAYQAYCLTYNDAGVGPADVAPVVATGDNIDTDTAQTTAQTEALHLVRQRTVTNTLVVFPAHDDRLVHIWSGVDLDFVRTLRH